MYANTFSIFRQSAKCDFLSLLPLLIRSHHTLYPGWDFVLNCDFRLSGMYSVVLNDLHDVGLIRLDIHNERPPLCVGMLWRMSQIWDGKYSAIFCRDLDSLLTPRQTKYVLDFLGSDKIVHGINDNEAHNIPLMGGMIGFKCREFITLTGFQSLNDIINKAGFTEQYWDGKGSDQTALLRVVWPIVRDYTLLHKPDGPNDREHLKDCVPGINLEYVSEQVRQCGDDFTCYIGACGGSGKPSLEYMVNFYRKYGNQETEKILTEIELKHRITWND